MRIHRLGARPLYELILELADEHGDDVLRCAEKYAALDLEILELIRGDKFPLPPLRRIS
ncbi:MAG TPA: hypothetical protein VGR52_01495 [Stellaceae bacterium]|nr:hypothetical protein [Stellaceae bacterium]